MDSPNCMQLCVLECGMCVCMYVCVNRQSKFLNSVSMNFSHSHTHTYTHTHTHTRPTALKGLYIDQINSTPFPIFFISKASWIFFFKLTKNFSINVVSDSFFLITENNQCVLAGKMLGLVFCLLNYHHIIFISCLDYQKHYTFHINSFYFYHDLPFPLTITTPATVFLKVISDLLISKFHCSLVKVF